MSKHIVFFYFLSVDPVCSIDVPNQCPGTTTCYANDLQCDSVRDCPDGSDEELCRKYAHHAKK